MSNCETLDCGEDSKIPIETVVANVLSLGVVANHVTVTKAPGGFLEIKSQLPDVSCRVARLISTRLGPCLSSAPLDPKLPREVIYPPRPGPDNP